MKKTALSILILSLVLTALTACGAQAQQPEPAPQVDRISTAEPEPLTEAEKPEISREDLLSIFETVYTSAADSHPEDWSIDFQITDEVGKINAAIPEDVKAPSDLRVMYTEWRTEQTAQDTPEPPAPEAEEPAISEPLAEPVAQQPTTSSNSGTGTTPQGNSGTQSDASGEVKTFDSEDLYVDTDPDDTIGTITTGESNQSDTSTTQTPTTTQNSSDIKPAGTVITVNGKTYTSTGESCFGTWTICTNEQGQRVAISKSGTIKPLLTQDVDLGDGGEKYADGMTTNELGSGSFNG